MKSSSSALLHIINDILDYSKIEAGKLEIVDKEFIFEELLENVTSLFSYRIQRDGLDFSYVIDPTIPRVLIGDSLRITQVLNNLISNSLKFTHEGFIALRTSIVYRGDDILMLRFCVQDTGIGISRENQSRLFRAFQQADSSITREYGGTGLGLMISKQLDELMGGGITLDSQEGTGSTFCFTLPVGYVPDGELVNGDALKEKKFLIIRDNSVDGGYPGTVLSSWGIPYGEADSGVSALGLLENDSYDFLIADYRNPCVDGLSLLESLKTKKIRVPRIFLVPGFEKERFILMAEERDLSVGKVLEKPYALSGLYNALFHRDLTAPREDTGPVQAVIREPAKALIVEDNAVNQTISRIHLEKFGFEVFIAGNGREAVELAGSIRFDIIFMDLQMPVMDGYEASRLIRGSDEKVPIIALSAAVMENDKARSAEAGMNHHLAKPIDKEELGAIIALYFDVVPGGKITGQGNERPEDESERDGIDMAQLDSVIEDEVFRESLLDTFAGAWKDFTEKALLFDVMEKSFSRKIHSLKGASGNLSAYAVHDLCDRLERTESREQKEVLRTRLIQELEKVIAQISSQKKAIQKGEEIVTREELAVIIDQWIVRLNDFEVMDTTEINTLINQLNPYTVPSISERLRKAIEGFESVRSCELLKEIRKDLL